MDYNTFNSQYWQNYWILFVTHGFGDSMGRKEIKTFPYKSRLNLCNLFFQDVEDVRTWFVFC